MYLSIVTPCFNEEGNIVPLCEKVREVLADLKIDQYEHIIIDNCSTDRTPELLREVAGRDRRVKVIFNSRNFGHIRSPYYALLQAKGDAVIHMASDFQDPPELIREFIKKWKEGFKVVVGVKNKSKENFIIFNLRKLYYHLLDKFSETVQIKNFTGFGLYDRIIIEKLRLFREPYPYFRGLIAEIGFPVGRVEFVQPRRKAGKTKNNFFTLYDIAMNGFVSHSRVPLRLATFLGFAVALVDLVVAFGYLIFKLSDWYGVTVGIAPLTIGLFFVGAVQLIFIGVIGEYVGKIHLGVKNWPLVIEKERLNFDQPAQMIPRHLPSSTQHQEANPL